MATRMWTSDRINPFVVWRFVMSVVELSGLVCPSWCRADLPVLEGWLHLRLLWEAELVRGWTLRCS
jgi:hypothetical protein